MFDFLWQVTGLMFVWAGMGIIVYAVYKTVNDGDFKSR